MSSKKVTADILKEHGARPDLRLFRNETGLFWTGNVLFTTPEGHVMLEKPSRVMAGLVKGSSDLIGIGPDGRFIAIEIKAGKDRANAGQRAFLEMVQKFGGIAGVARSVDDVNRLLGFNPKRG